MSNRTRIKLKYVYEIIIYYYYFLTIQLVIFYIHYCKKPANKTPLDTLKVGNFVSRIYNGFKMDFSKIKSPIYIY